jgi:hypothetical protein
VHDSVAGFYIQGPAEDLALYRVKILGPRVESAHHISADDHLLIPLPPEPETTEAPPHPRRWRLDVVAVLVACGALGGTVWQSCEATQARAASERSAQAAEDRAREAKELNDLTKHSLVLAQTAASAAERSAGAADKQAQAAIDQVALGATGTRLTAESLRARVTARGVTLREKPVAGQALRADVHVENTGHSEAVDVRVRMTASRGRSLPAGAMPSIAVPPNGSAGVLAPDGKMSSDLVIHATEMTPEVVGALMSGDSPRWTPKTGH